MRLDPGVRGLSLSFLFFFGVVLKFFRGPRAHDVCFELDAGEVHALMGENGAGKSTLMKILAGVYRKDTGEILLDGRAIEIDSPREAQAAGIGIIHQELHLMNHLTAAQNIFIGREPRAASACSSTTTRSTRRRAASSSA